MKMKELEACKKELADVGYPDDANSAFLSESHGPESRYYAAILVQWAGSHNGGTPVLYLNRASFRGAYKSVDHSWKKSAVEF